MKELETSKIAVGQVAELNYLNADGSLLISKGVIVTQKHIDALKRRNIVTVYLQEHEGDHEIEKILSREFSRLDDLELDGPGHLALKDIKYGQEGFNQLVNTRKVADLDRKIELGFAPDKPVGPALKESMTQVSVAERTANYKTNIASTYAGALSEVKSLMTALIMNRGVEGTQVRKIVEGFMRTFLTDKNILLNISGIKHDGDDYLFNHLLNVCLLSLNIAAASDYSEPQIVEIGMCGLLHDIGMLLIPQTIRFKKGKLSPDEWFEVQKHPVLGLHLLEKINRLPVTVAITAYQTHERENSTGYPRKRNSILIHNFAKIVQCADIFEAVSSPRSYREAMVPYYGMEMLVKMARQGFLSGDFVKSFLTFTSLFPVGSIVELSDHSIGRVVAANATAYTKPTVSVLVDKDGKVLEERHIYQINLKENPDFQILKSYRHDYLENLGIMKGF